MESIKEILFDIFEEKLTDYYGTNSIRTSQVQMAFDIAEFLQPNNSKKIMMVEAPVGTGKSLGALIPSLLRDRKSTRLNSSHVAISYAVFCLKKKKTDKNTHHNRT